MIIEAVLQRRALVSAFGRLNRVSLPLLGAALGLELVSLSAAAALQRRLLAGGGVQVPLRSLLALVWASNAVGASLPAGAAASATYTYRHLTRRGTPGRLAGWLLVASGIVSFATLALLVVLGVQFRGLLSHCTAHDALELVALTCAVTLSIALLAWVSERPSCLSQVGHCLQRVTASMRRLARCSPPPNQEGPTNVPTVMLGGRGWLVVVALGALNWVADGAVLTVSLVAVGANIPWRGLVLAYALSQVGASVPILPGSIGIAEASLVAVLVCAGVSAPDALAATVTYRLASFWLQLLPGWAAWARLRHSPPFDRAAAPRHASLQGWLQGATTG